MLLFLAGSIALLARVQLSQAQSATTTHYTDGLEGACGCGSGGSGFSWQNPNGIASGIYTAAASQGIYGDGNASISWCGGGCGTCYQLTSTGTSPPGQGTGGGTGQTVTVMVTNLCPEDSNSQWCPNPGGTNQYGYSAHFDIQGGVPGWNNPIVTYTQVACPAAATADWHTCVCYAPGTSLTTTNPPPSSTTSKPTSSSSSKPSSSSSKPVTTTTTASGAVQTKYGQCGGVGWTGATTCASGSTCTASGAYYSQCL